jgi:hypothetical protein
MNLAAKQSCHIRKKLAGSYATAARLYAEAVVNLAIQETRGPEFERSREQEREAWECAGAARLIFKKHVASHGC